METLPIPLSDIKVLSDTVFGGALRIYLPGIDLDAPKLRRHRWFGASKRETAPGFVPQMIAREISPRMAQRRPPVLYTGMLDEQQRLDRSFLIELLHRTGAEAERLELQYERAEASRIEAVTELADEVDRWLRASLPPERAAWGDAESVEDLVRLAGAGLSGVEVATATIHDLDMDPTFAECRLWIARLARTLLAMDAFARSDEPDFLAWCEADGSSGIDPSMVSVRRPTTNDPMLPVSSEVRRTRRVRMAHQVRTTLAEDDHAPIIRFHDDRGGRTGRVHIGFVGPASELPRDSVAGRS